VTALLLAAGVLALVAAAGSAVWYGYPDLARAGLLGLARRAAGLQTLDVTIDGHRVRCLVKGLDRADASGPPIVLLHGIFAEKEHWLDFARALPRQRCIVVPDLPGFGQSDRLDSARYGYAEQVLRLLALLDALGLPKVHLAGSSMGGTLAALFALRFPQRVASVAFIGAPHGLRSAVPSAADRLIDAGEIPLIARDPAGFDQLLDRLFERRPWLPYPVLQFARRQALQRAPSNRRLWREHVADRYRLHDCIGALTPPVLALWGRHDRIFDASGVQVLQVRLPEATVHVLDGVGHLPMMEVPSRTARHYTRFLATLPGPAT
jgi:pimeloyl-ACP methyl ester carboxylesterase